MAITDELKELYSSSGTDVILRTLSLTHSSWNEPFYIVSDFQDFTANLENSGELVTFKRFSFSVSGPNKDVNGNRSLKITIDNVSREIMDLLELAVLDETQVPIEVTYRVYIDSDTTTPQATPLTLYLKNISCNNQRLTGVAELVGLVNRKFPSVEYGFQFKSLLRAQ